MTLNDEIQRFPCAIACIKLPERALPKASS